MEQIERLKAEICYKIAPVEDETTLELLQKALTKYSSVKPVDIEDELFPSQQLRLKESVQQADKGNVFTDESIKQMSRSWLCK